VDLDRSGGWMPMRGVFGVVSIITGGDDVNGDGIGEING